MMRGGLEMFAGFGVQGRMSMAEAAKCVLVALPSTEKRFEDSMFLHAFSMGAARSAALIGALRTETPWDRSTLSFSCLSGGCAAGQKVARYKSIRDGKAKLTTQIFR